MSESVARIGGSGFTVLTWGATRLAFLQSLQDTPPQPVAAAQAVQPIDEETPIEIVTAKAVGAGTLRLTFYEIWNQPVWATLPGLAGTNNLLDVLKKQVSLGEISCRKVIKSPTGGYRVRVYHNCVITDIDEGENVNIGTMTLPKTITIQYTRTSTV